MTDNLKDTSPISRGSQKANAANMKGKYEDKFEGFKGFYHTFYGLCDALRVALARRRQRFEIEDHISVLPETLPKGRSVPRKSNRSKFGD